MKSAAPRRVCVIGHPVQHSRSPLIHNHWMEIHKIAGSYERLDVPPGNFDTVLKDLAGHGLTGANITVPYKERAYGLVDEVDSSALMIQAINTVWRQDGKLWGGNSDIYGFLANLDEYAPGWDSAEHAVVLGAGGAARAVVHALLVRKIKSISVVNRTVSRAQEMRDHLGGISAHPWVELPDLLASADLVINATSIGMSKSAPPKLDPMWMALPSGLRPPPPEEKEPEPQIPDLTPLRNDAIVTDIVYVPLETELLAAARERGNPVVDGLGMLLHQAVFGFEKWFGVRPEVTPELRALIEKDLQTPEEEHDE